jgi:hypothetical protein
MATSAMNARAVSPLGSRRARRLSRLAVGLDRLVPLYSSLEAALATGTADGPAAEDFPGRVALAPLPEREREQGRGEAGSSCRLAGLSAGERLSGPMGGDRAISGRPRPGRDLSPCCAAVRPGALGT